LAAGRKRGPSSRKPASSSRGSPLERPAPSSAAWAALGPYAQTRLTVHALGRSLPLDVPGDVFATHRIDEGTQLLLGHLPPREPSSFLDLGCGYGALGLPVAARFPQARALLVDRDLLAVRASAHNARASSLRNVVVLPSLGYRDLPLDAPPFDWILCNVPARIGPEAIGSFLAQGRALLAPQGELRAVVIRDLIASVEAQARARDLPVEAVAHGPRHSVFALAARPGPAALPGPERGDRAGSESIYARDETRFSVAGETALALSRPHDISEDAGHLGALSVLVEALPRRPPARALVFRCGYGALPLALRRRAPEALVVAQDRDLLDTTFLRRNARALALDGALLRVEETLFPAEAAREGERFDLVAGELSASAGEAVSARELSEAHALLAPGGEALVLLTPRQRREWLPAVVPPRSAATILLERPQMCVLRLSRPRGR
jgi:16S rRNA (guanine1207-N2)-methyltransferase